MDAVKAFESLTNRTVMGLMLIAVIGGLVFAIWIADRKVDNFRIVDALMDEKGKANLLYIILGGTWVIHSWAFVAWVMNGAATLADLGAYGTTWALPVLAKIFIDRKTGGAT